MIGYHLENEEGRPVPSRSAIYRTLVLIDIKDGSLLSVAAGEPARAWDIQTGRLIGEFGTPVDTSLDGNWVGATFDPTEPRLYAEVDIDLIGIFTLEPDELMEIARSRLSRELTEEECTAYLHLEGCPG